MNGADFENAVVVCSGHANLPIGPAKAARLSDAKNSTNTKLSLTIAFKECRLWIMNSPAPISFFFADPVFRQYCLREGGRRSLGIVTLSGKNAFIYQG